MHVPSLHIPRSRAGPGNELEDDTARVCDLEKALAPLLRLDWRRNRDFLAEQPGVFDVDVIDDENDEKTVGTVSGSGGRLERRKADTEEDRLKPAFGWAKDTNPSAAISSSKPKWRLANSAEAAGSSTLSEIVDAVICIGRIRLILTPALAAPRVRGRSHLLDVERPQRDEDREHGDHLEPGQGSSPYYEYEEEWLLVVEATLVLRASDLEHTLERGDLVRFPPGSAGAHKLMNRSEFPARTLMFSSSRVPAVAVIRTATRSTCSPATRSTSCSSSAAPRCVVAGRGGLGQSKLTKTITDGAAVLIQVVSTTGACASGPGCAGDDHSRFIIASASISRSTYSSPETSTIASLIVPPVNANGRSPG